MKLKWNFLRSLSAILIKRNRMNKAIIFQWRSGRNKIRLDWIKKNRIDLFFRK